MDELGRRERADELEAEESDRSMWSYQVVRIVSLQRFSKYGELRKLNVRNVARNVAQGVRDQQV